MKRWACPQCSSGVLAPQSPHVDDVRRFCFACSAKTGRLVRRVCPSTKRLADARKDAARAKRAATKARREAKEAARWAVAGVDVRDLWRKCWVALLPIVRARVATAMLAGTNVPSLAPPKLALARRARAGHTWTWNHDTYLVDMVFTPTATEVFVRASVVEALVWIALGGSRAGVLSQSSVYNRTLSEVAKRLWGIKIPRDPGPGTERALLRQLQEKFGQACQDGGGAPPTETSSTR